MKLWTMTIHLGALWLVSSPAWSRTIELDVRLGSSPATEAVDYARRHGARFGRENPRLALDRVTAIRNGLVGVVQFEGALEVLGSGLSLLILNNRLVAASGELLSVEKVAEGLPIDRSIAERILSTSFPTSKVRRGRMVLWPHTSPALPVWLYEIQTSRPFDVIEVALDGIGGRQLWSRSTLIPVSGKVYANNPVVSTIQQVELLGLTAPGQLTGEYADVQSCALVADELKCVRNALPDADGNYFFVPEEPSTTDAFAEVQAYYHVDTFHRHMKSTFGFARKGTSQQISVIVNYAFQNDEGDSKGIYNAFYGDTNGDGVGDLTFGQGKSRDFVYDADVIYHEFTHSVVQETSDLSVGIDQLGLNLMSGALNEAFADLFSSAFAGDSKVGEYAGNGAIRDLAGSVRRCPDHLVGETHEDGLIWGRAIWALRGQASSSATFDQVLYKTMVGLSKSASIVDAAQLFLTLAQQEDASIVPLAQAEFAARGLLSCGRIIDLPLDTPRQAYISGTRSIGTSVVPAAFQYLVSVPGDALSLTITLKKVGGGGMWGSQLALGLFVRKGETVKFVIPTSIYDFVMNNEQSSITLTKGDAERPLEPGAVYYLLPVNVGLGSGAYSIRAAVTVPTPSPDAGSVTLDLAVSADAGPAADTASSGPQPESPAVPASKGGCRIGGSSRGVALGLGLLLLCLIGIRRWRC
jgi:hypothetical protein